MEAQMIEQRVRQFLVQQFPATKNVSNDAALLNNGLIDSLGILEIVSFLEAEFGITVSDEDLLPENFGSVQSLSSYVQQKRNEAA